MAKLEFNVVLKPNLRLLIDRLDALIEDEVHELSNRVKRKTNEIDYKNLGDSLSIEMESILNEVVLSRYGETEMIECNVSVVKVGEHTHIVGTVEFNTPNYVIHGSTKEDVSYKLAESLANWYSNGREVIDVLEELIKSQRTFRYSIMFGYGIQESEAFITSGEV